MKQVRQTDTVNTQVLDALRAVVITGELQPGTLHSVQTLATQTGRRELRKLYQAMEKAARTDDEYRMWEHDRRFHLVLLQASGNLRLAEYVDGLRDMVLRRGVSTAGLSRSLDDIVAEHGEVLAHIESGDADGAAEAMGAHVLRTAELLIAQEAGAPPGSVDIDLGWTGHP